MNAMSSCANCPYQGSSSLSATIEPSCITMMWNPTSQVTSYSQVTLDIQAVERFVGKKTLLRSIVLPLMSPTHIVVISLQRPLKAITAPVVTPSRHRSKISVWAAAGMTVISCSRPDSFQKRLGGTTLNWLPKWMKSVDGNQITLCDGHPSTHPNSPRG